jgi:hypothetical protein
MKKGWERGMHQLHVLLFKDSSYKKWQNAINTGSLCQAGPCLCAATLVHYEQTVRERGPVREGDESTVYGYIGTLKPNSEVEPNLGTSGQNRS